MKGTVTIDRSTSEVYDTLTVEQGGARLRVVAERRTFTGGPDWMATQLRLAARMYGIGPDGRCEGGICPPLDDPQPGPTRTVLEKLRGRGLTNREVAGLFREAAAAAERLEFPAALPNDGEEEYPRGIAADAVR